MGRIMAKTFEVDRPEDGKGSPLQSKINAFTQGKNIDTIVDVAVSDENGKIHGTLLFTLGEGEPTERVLSKVVSEEAGSKLQTKVNSFTKDKELDLRAHAISTGGGRTTVVLLYAKPVEEASAEAAAEPVAAAAE